MTRVVHVQKVSGISGSEAHLLSLLPLLRGLGWDARMLVLDEGEEGAAAFAKRMRARRVPVERLRMRSDLDPLAFARLAVRLARLRPTLVHTHLVHADVLAQPAAALARVPVRASTKHGFDPFREQRAVVAADRAAARLAHVHVAISRGLARYLAETEGFDEAGFAIVHYGIELRAGARPYDGREPRFLCVGRLIPIKGHSVLLRALAEARRELPSLTLDIAGSGPLEEELRTLAAELGLGDAVRFLGHVTPVEPLLERSAAVVVPSLGEGFGMVALEAMERARPVVASRAGGLPELVRHGETGLLVPPGEVEPLARALVELGRDRERAARLGAAARARAERRFSARRCVERTDALYRSALARAR